ncbi:MAG: TlpA family protein disulfide reductase [Chloroflexi bacterium]|jgi:thiol-disulfide isomerase/thioredoxin|nr:TlpA family protein disulfide reductase [Chloroflexota bacterium]
MRAPILAGVLAGVFAALLVAAAFVALALSGPTATPAPSMVAAPSVTPPVAAPTEPTSEPTPSVSFTTPAPSPLPTTSPGPSPSPSPGDPQVGVAVGDIAPPLRLAQLGGAEVDTEALRGQPLWVNFMATWCPPCREELPIMDRLQRDLGDRMTIIVVDVEEDADTVASFFNSLEVALPVALDEDGRAQEAWNAVALPVHYWIDEEGRVGGVLYGGAGPEQFIEGIETVLPDAGVEP